MTKAEVEESITREFEEARETPFFKEYVLTGMKGTRSVPRVSDDLDALSVHTNYDVEIRGRLSVMATLLIYYFNWFAWSTDPGLTPAQNRKLSKESMARYEKLRKLVFSPRFRKMFDGNIYSAVN